MKPSIIILSLGLLITIILASIAVHHQLGAMAYVPIIINQLVWIIASIILARLEINEIVDEVCGQESEDLLYRINKRDREDALCSYCERHNRIIGQNMCPNCKGLFDCPIS